jgi:hypothetical protein
MRASNVCSLDAPVADTDSGILADLIAAPEEADHLTRSEMWDLAAGLRGWLPDEVALLELRAVEDWQALAPAGGDVGGHQGPDESPLQTALRSRWGAAGKKNRGNRFQWFECWLAPLVPALQSQAQLGVFGIKSRLTQW